MRIGIDLGGTKVEIMGLERDGTPMHRRRVPAARGDYDGTVRLVRDLVAAADPGGRAPVGVAIPGTETPDGRIKNANSTWLIGRPLAADLAAALGRPVRLMNDANCFVLSEAADGAAAGAAVVFGVILGTGVGGGLIVHGHPVAGCNGIAGEWGHNPLPWPDPDGDESPGPACYCGRRGCLETFLSGPGLAADHRRHGGADQDGPAIAAAAEAGDPAARASLARHAHRLARGLAQVINLLDPDVIVLGGGLSNLGHLYDRVPDLWRPFVFSDTVTTRLVPPIHGDSSGVRGAAWLWPAEAIAAHEK